MRFVIRKAKNAEFYWQLVGGNGEVMAVSEQMKAEAVMPEFQRLRAEERR